MYVVKNLVLRVTSKDVNVYHLINLNSNVIQGNDFVGTTLKDYVLSLKVITSNLAEF
jgi:hypothetical protein